MRENSHKVTSYPYTSSFPEHKEIDWDVQHILLCNEDPEDEELWVGELTQPWKDHPKGSIIVGGLSQQGYPFYIIDPSEESYYCQFSTYDSDTDQSDT